jgi:hypothetical protein
MTEQQLRQEVANRLEAAVLKERIRIAWMGDGNSKPMGIVSGSIPAPDETIEPLDTLNEA